MKKGLLVCALVVAIMLSLVVGIQSIPVNALFQMNQIERTIFWHTRLPRTISLVIAGATLSICGLIMQQLTQNKFVSPSTTGTMDSARLGILFVMVCLPNASSLIRGGVAFVFSFFGTVLFLKIIQQLPTSNQTLVPLVGMMLGNVIGAIVTFFAYQLQVIQNITAWLQGNFATVTTGGYELLFLAVPLLFLTYGYARHFTVIGLGEEMAQGVGLSYRQVQYLGLLIVASASSLVLVTVGSVPFLGIIVPNIVSLYFGDNVRHTLWIAAVSGSLLLVLCDLLARTVIQPFEIPVSVIMGVFGSLIFIYLLIKEAKQ